MIERKGIGRVEQEVRKERLPDEEAANLIAAIGNHEAKSLTLLLMMDGIIYTRGDLYRVLLEAQGEKKRWVMNCSTPFDYCEKSLSPIGLVAEEVIDPFGRSFGYIKTEYGRKVGNPLAGLLLDFSKEHPQYSLIKVWGGTGSPSPQTKEIETGAGTLEYRKRAPGIRLKIFRELLKTQLPIRTTDLAQRIREKQSLSARHLLELSWSGIITYEAKRYGQPFTFYRLPSSRPETPPPAYLTSPSLTQSVYQIIISNSERWWSREEVVNHIIKENQSKQTHRSLMKTVSNILSHLYKHGYAERQKFSTKTQSEITLTEEQRNFLSELVLLIDSFQNQDPETLEKGRKLANFFRSHPEEISLLLAKAKEHSSLANKRPSQETENWLLFLLITHPRSTAHELRELLEQEYERRLSSLSVGRILRNLRDQGRVLGKGEKGMRWEVRRKE